MDEERRRELLRKLSEPLTIETDEPRTAITLDLCSEIETTRGRIGGISTAISRLILPAFIAAIGLAVLAYQFAVH